MAKESPDDCAIQFSWVLGNKPFVLDRLPSTGALYEHITFSRDDGSLKIDYRGEPRRFTISFRLPEQDESGGFAGIRAWPEKGRELKEFYLTGKIPHTPFHVHHETNNDKVTLLRIDDWLDEPATYFYCLGLYQTDNRTVTNIVPDDPRIYNNWEPPLGGCLSWRTLLFSIRRGGRRR